MHRQVIRTHLADTEMTRGIAVLEKGGSQWQVATALNASQSVISRMWDMYHSMGSVHRIHSGGGQCLMTPRSDLFLMLLT